ncbi:MAG TPA: beta-galactosidase [Verrucomicrobiae bacterium]
MYFGVDYYPEQWVFPYGGTVENPEAAWEQDAALMAKAGINVVRIGEFSWGVCEPEEGRHDFLWLRRVMDIMARHGHHGASRHQGDSRHAHRRAAHLARQKTF